jgi:hypothetical protein
VLTMDVHPLQLNLGAVGGHLEVDRQLPDGILPPWHASIEESHDSAQQKVLRVVHIAKDVLAVWSLRTLFATAWTIAPTLSLGSFFDGIDCKQ